MSVCTSMDEWHRSVPSNMRWPAVIGVAILALWGGGFAVWAALAPLDGAVVASGSFVATGQNKNVQHLEGGIVREVLVREGELVNAGVVLSSGAEFGGGGPTFLFRGLNQLKPEMIAEATARAREAATQFAQDSRTSLGGIRRANQGVFEILPRDQAQGITEASQIDKMVRVVSTVEYTLR